eukprot:2628338-Pleurochrysis_carterae.AAC.3
MYIAAHARAQLCAREHASSLEDVISLCRAVCFPFASTVHAADVVYCVDALLDGASVLGGDDDEQGSE